MPSTLTAKIQAYESLTGKSLQGLSAQQAIRELEAFGTTLTKAEKQELTKLQSLNGNKAWGVFDGFEKTETARFGNDLAAGAKKDPVHAMQYASERAIQRDVAQNPEKYEPKRYDRPSGRYVVCRKDKTNGKQIMTFFNKNGKKMSETTFKIAEGIIDIRYINGDEESLPMMSGDVARKHIAQHAGQLFTREKRPGIIDNNAGFIFTACSNENDVVNNFTNENKNVINVTIKQELSALENLVKTLIEQGIDLQTTLNKITELLKDMNGTNKDVKDIVAAILAAVKNNGSLLDLIIDNIGNSNELLKLIFDEMVKGNNSLKELKDMLLKKSESDTEYQKKVLELLANINAKLDGIRADLRGYYNNIIKTLAAQGTSLEDIKKILNKINANVEKIQALIDKYGNNAVSIGQAIMNAIANLKLEANVDLSKVEALLEKLVNGQVVTQNQLNDLANIINNFGYGIIGKLDAILEAIKKNGEVGDGIKALLAEVLANQVTMIKNNKAGFEAVIEAIKGISVTSGVPDLSKIEALLTALVDIGKSNGCKLDNLAKQNDVIITILKSFKADVNAKLDVVNGKLDQLDANQKEIIEFLKKLSNKADVIISKLNQGGGCNLDFDTLMAKLQEILEAIKDHEVHVTVEGEITCKCNCGQGTHEGILGDLDSLLG